MRTKVLGALRANMHLTFLWGFFKLFSYKKSSIFSCNCNISIGFHGCAFFRYLFPFLVHESTLNFHLKFIQKFQTKIQSIELGFLSFAHRITSKLNDFSMFNF